MPSAPVNRTTYHHGDLRRALIDAAVALLAEGNADPSLREVAKRARVSVGAPYHHFSSKDALLATVACEGFEALEATLAQTAGGRSPSERLRRRCTTYVEFAAAHPDHYRVMFRSSLMREPTSPLRQVAAAAFGRLEAAIAEVREDLASPVIHQLALMTWSMAHGLVQLWNDGVLAEEPGGLKRLATSYARRALELVEHANSGSPGK
ncbi:MAG: TetR/AcrR family transcriptional regulator [Kofleriaceae bacterium]|nr:TetR/AcrR family transcriptional regulator [Kofleriaceae bacterium]